MDCYLYFIRSFPEKEDLIEIKKVLTSKGYRIKGILFRKYFVREREGISVVIDPSCDSTYIIDSQTVFMPYNPILRDYTKLKSLKAPHILRLFDADKKALIEAIKGKNCTVEFNLSGIDIYTEDEEDFAEMRESLREYIYAEGYESMEEVVVKLLREFKKTVVTAESCTGGLVASRIVNVPGSSEVFMGSFVVYSNEFKVKFLSVDETAIKERGAVSEEVCREMVIGAVETAEVDIAVAVTGIAGPGGTEEKPQGLTYIGVGDGERVYIDRRIFNSTRNINRFLSSQVTLNNLRKFIRGVL